MFKTRIVVFAALVPLVLHGCAVAPPNRTLSPAVAAAVQPVDVRIGIRQPELYAKFELSAISNGAVACGIVPGIGILLAAACGGLMGAMDATVNAQRAKEADELVRPLKDTVIDVKHDEMFTNSISTSLRGIPSMQYASLQLTKTVDDKAYEEIFRSSSSGAVMFVNLDYHLSIDFSTLEVSAAGLLFPRSVAARTATGKPPQLSEDTKGKPLMAHEAVYRADIVYRASLPKTAETAGGNIEAWKANNGRLLRTALEDGGRQVAQLLAEEMQRAPGAEQTVLGTAEFAKGQTGQVLRSQGATQLFRAPNGALVYKTTVSPPAGQAASAAMAQ